MAKIELTKRYILFIFGLFINATGISLITKAGLGTSPISSLPYTFSLGTPFTLGQLTFALNIVLIVGQILLLRKDFKLVQFLQIPISVLFGFFVDLTMFLFNALEPTFYPLKIAALLGGCLILGCGVAAEVIADVVMLSGEAFVVALCGKLKKDFGLTKVCFDATLALRSCVTSLILFGAVISVREGTIIAAVLVGLFAKFFRKRLSFLDRALSGKKKPQEQTLAAKTETNSGERRQIITIGREYGSGGHEIGKRLAAELGVAFYDHQLIDMVAKESGYKQGYIEETEERASRSFLYDLILQNYEYIPEKLSPLDALFVAQSKVIRDICEKESCVIVGRCANYILADKAEALHVFIHADKESRIQRLVATEGLNCQVAEGKIRKTDKERRARYKRYTGSVWGFSDHYNLTIDSGRFGIDLAIKIIKDALAFKESKELNE